MRVRIAAALALVVVASIHLFAVARFAQRKDLAGDEIELLHAALRMRAGERIFVDFFEHHSPFIFQALSAIAPASPPSPAAVRAYVFRARVWATLFGTLALAAAAFVVWRATGQLYAAAIFTGVLLASPTLWTHAIAQIRGEPPALAAFWTGALLILAAGSTPLRRVTLGAIGIGLVALSCLINPKWPIASAVLGCFFVAGAAKSRLLRRGLLLATVAAGSVVVVLALTVDLRRFYDFVFVFNRYNFQWWPTQILPSTNEAIPYFHCPRLLRPHLVLPLAALVVAAIVAARDAYRDARVTLALVLLLVASLIEVRFVDPFPDLLVQYYSLFGMVGAAIYACVPQAVVALVKRFAPGAGPFARAVPAVATLLAVVNAPGVIPVPGDADANVVAREALASWLRPGDTVFLDASQHPIGARDASYYWFSFRAVPVALKLATTPAGRRMLPPIREEDLPPCLVERGLDAHVRLISGGVAVERLPVVAGCIGRLEKRGLITRTHIKDVFMVRRATMTPLL